MSRSSSWPNRKPRATTSVSSIAILPGERWRRAAIMAPDAEAGKASGNRSDPFAPLTSQLLPIGDGHEIYVETVGRADGVPAVYLHGGPGSGCQPDHRRLFDPERFHAVLFDQRGHGRSRPNGRLEHNTLPHLLADMEIIREKFGFERWMIVGGSWGATLALAYAQTHPNRVTGIVLRATFLGTRAELEGAFLDALPRFYPDLSDDFLKLLPPEERAQPLDAYWRRILDSDPAVHGPAAHAWGDTERILSGHVSGRVRDFFRGVPCSILIRQTRHAPSPPRRSWKRITFRTTASCGRGSCWRKQASWRASPRSSCKAATIYCVRRPCRTRWRRCGPRPKSAPSRAPVISCTIP